MIQIKLKDSVGIAFRELSNIAGLTHSDTLAELIRIYFKCVQDYPN